MRVVSVDVLFICYLGDSFIDASSAGGGFHVLAVCGRDFSSTSKYMYVRVGSRNYSRDQKDSFFLLQ